MVRYAAWRVRWDSGLTGRVFDTCLWCGHYLDHHYSVRTSQFCDYQSSELLGGRTFQPVTIAESAHG